MGYPCLDIELGTSIADLQNLRTLGLPDPDSWTFIWSLRQEVDGTGLIRGFGYASASLTWETLSQDMYDALNNFYTSTEASGRVYAWLYTDEGKGPGSTRARFYGVMHRPVDGQGKSMISGTRRPTYNNVTVQFTHLEAA